MRNVAKVFFLLCFGLVLWCGHDAVIAYNTHNKPQLIFNVILLVWNVVNTVVYWRLL